MKKLISGAFAGGLLLASVSLSAQTATPPQTPSQPQKTNPVVTPTKPDRGSEGAITMEEYETLLKEYQKVNPGKTFQNMSKEEFETYLTTELSRLRQKRAAEAKQQQQPAQPR